MSSGLVLFILLAYFGILILISYFTSRKSDNETFFTANRTSPWYLVAFGMIGTSLSGVTFISIPGEVGNSNWTYLPVVMGNCIGYVVIALVLLPLFYKLNLVSIYSWLGIRFGETVKAYAASEALDVADLKLIPMVFAGWVRYLMAVDDKGEKMELSADPLLDTVCPIVADIKLGETTDVDSILKPLLENAAIFGVNLYEVGLADKVCEYFKSMIAGPGAVRATLEAAVNA